jgi:hypothetical protein
MAAFATTANAISLINSGSYGGHQYQVYSDPEISWTEANDWTTTVLGDGWQLVSITSELEQLFVESLLVTPPSIDRAHFWIGLTDTAVEGTYVWNSGEPYGYTDWHGGEPSNGPGEEDYVAIDWRTATEQWAWNDIPIDGYPALQRGFVTERVSDGGSAMVLLGIVLLGVDRLRRRTA